jgi:hypothetical protein
MIVYRYEAGLKTSLYIFALYFPGCNIPQPDTCNGCIDRGQSVLKKVRFTLQPVMKAQRGSIGIALLTFNLTTRCGWVVNPMPWPLYPWARDSVPTAQEAAQASRPV